MGTTADKLNKILETKSRLKTAIANKGQTITDSTPFSEYPTLVENISGEGLPNGVSYENNLLYLSFLDEGTDTIPFNNVIFNDIGDASSIGDIGASFNYVDGGYLITDYNMTNSSGAEVAFKNLATDNESYVELYFSEMKNQSEVYIYGLNGFEANNIRKGISVGGKTGTLEPLPSGISFGKNQYDEDAIIIDYTETNDIANGIYDSVVLNLGDDTNGMYPATFINESANDYSEVYVYVNCNFPNGYRELFINANDSYPTDEYGYTLVSFNNFVENTENKNLVLEGVPNLISSNIKNGVNIAGVEGTFVGVGNLPPQIEYGDKFINIYLDEDAEFVNVFNNGIFNIELGSYNYGGGAEIIINDNIGSNLNDYNDRYITMNFNVSNHREIYFNGDCSMQLFFDFTLGDPKEVFSINDLPNYLPENIKKGVQISSDFIGTYEGGGVFSGFEVFEDSYSTNAGLTFELPVLSRVCNYLMLHIKSNDAEEPIYYLELNADDSYVSFGTDIWDASGGDGFNDFFIIVDAQSNVYIGATMSDLVPIDGSFSGLSNFINDILKDTTNTHSININPLDSGSNSIYEFDVDIKIM